VFPAQCRHADLLCGFPAVDTLTVMRRIISLVEIERLGHQTSCKTYMSADMADDQFPPEKTLLRAEALARAVLNLPPERQKDVPKKRGVSKRKAGKAAKPSPSKPS